MSTDDCSVLVFTADNEITANMVEALLTDNNIPVLRKYRGLGQYLKMVLGNTTSGIDLYVPAGASEKAKELIDMIYAQDAEIVEELDDDDHDECK